MKSTYYHQILVFVSLCLLANNAKAQIDTIVDEAEIFLIDQLTSSSFEMVIYPTPVELDTSATAKVTSIITKQLSESSSGQKAAFNLNTVKLLVEGVTFEEAYELEERPFGFEDIFKKYVNASLLEFQVVVGIDNQDTRLTSPSQFVLDNLIVRTFSQPSTKSDFVYHVTQTMDPFLVEVDDITINYLVQERSNDDTPVGRKALSNIDIILITVSSAIFLCVFCILIPFNKKDGYKDMSEEGYTKRQNYDEHQVDETVSVDSSEVERFRVPLEKIMHNKGNIVDAGSLESSIDSQSQNILSVVHESPVVSYASSDSTSACSSSSSSLSSSSSSSSSSNISSRTKFSDQPAESRLVVAEQRMDSEAMNSEGRQDSKTSTIMANDLASRLLNLPESDAYARRLRANAMYSSIASAPTVLEDIIGKWKTEETKIISSIRSNRSTASIEYLKIESKRKSASRISIHPSEKNRFAFNGLIMLGTTEEFHKSWLESQRKALEDFEEGSVDDVFQIDAQSNSSAIQRKEGSKSSSSTPVSEWMKLIRVVDSASETHSSLENSSIEPKMFEAKEGSSIDPSLEDSLAKSSFDPVMG